MANPVPLSCNIADTEVLEDREQIRYELWQGQPHAMTGGTPAHNLIALALRDVLRDQVKPCRVFTSDVAVRLGDADDADKAYPDLMVVCNPTTERVQQAPILLAEVLSDSSVRWDRVDKMRGYTRLDSCQVYLILHQTAQHVEVYRQENHWRVEHYLEGIIELGSPAVRIPLDAVYAELGELGLDLGGGAGDAL